MGQSNLALIYQNHADRGTLSGGSWQDGSLRLSNLLTPYLPQVARSASTIEADTQFTINFGALREIGGVAFGPCNVRPTATCRYRAYNGDILVYASGIQPFPHSSLPTVALEWGDTGFWEMRDPGFDDLMKGALFVHLPEEPISARTIEFEIFDEGNLAQYIEIGRLICGPVWQPSINYGYDGNSLDFQPLTDMEESRSGQRFFNARAVRRAFSFSFAYLSEAERFADIYRIATRAGTHNQVVVIPNPGDPDSFVRECFIGTLAEIPSLRRSTYGGVATSFKIEEAL